MGLLHLKPAFPLLGTQQVGTGQNSALTIRNLNSAASFPPELLLVPPWREA